MQCGETTDVAVADSALSPGEFYHRFLKPSTPVLLRPTKQPTAAPVDQDTAQNAAPPRPPPLLGRSVHDDWPSRSYLAREFGGSEVAVDHAVKENRSGTSADMQLHEFLAGYKREGWYMISPVPDEMAPHVRVPRVIAAPQYHGLMQDVVMWLNGHRSRSHLHFDNIQNMMCVIRGAKRFLLADKDQAHRVRIDVPRGDYSAVDVDSVDLAAYPGLEHVPWVRAVVLAGECLYVPVNWFHQVVSDADTFGINFWWTPFDRGTPSGGDVQDWQYTLDRVEFNPAEQLRYQLVRYLQERGAPATDADMQACFLGEDTLEPVLDGDARGFGILDLDGDGVLTMGEVGSTPISDLHRAFPDFDFGALYVKCRSDLGWVRSNRGLVDLADLTGPARLGGVTGDLAGSAEPQGRARQEL